MVFYTSGSIHWSCVECLVRPMCRERCHKTYLDHWKCEGCDKRQCMVTGFPCKTVEKYLMWERVQRAYGDQMLAHMKKHIEQTSIFSLFKIEKSLKNNNNFKRPSSSPV